MHGCKIGEQGASDKLDNIVRFWYNIPFKKEQQNRTNKKIDQPLRGCSFLNQTSMVSAH